MPIHGINDVFQGSRAGGARASLPRVPDEITRVRQEALTRYGDKGWSGLSFMQAGSAADVRAYLSEERDAARILVSANVPLFLVRYSHGTGRSMDAWLHEKPRDGKLKLTVTTMPSWHAPAPGANSAASALVRAVQGQTGVPKITAADVEAAIKSSPAFATQLETELMSVRDAADWFARAYADLVRSERPTADEARKLLGALMSDLGHEVMGMKFARENVYNVSVALPGGTTVRKRFDSEGNDPPKPGRKDTAYTATNSGEIEIDISAFAGKDIVIQAWPDGSAGVDGYREAREIRLHL